MRGRQQPLVLALHDVPAAHHREAAHVERHEPAFLDLRADRVGRDERDAQARHDGLLDRLVAADLHAAIRIEPRLGEQLLHQVPGSRAVLAQQEGFPGEVGEGNALAPGKTVVRRADDDVGVIPELSAFDLEVLPWPAGDGEIEIVIAQRLAPSAEDPLRQSILDGCSDARAKPGFALRTRCPRRQGERAGADAAGGASKPGTVLARVAADTAGFRREA